MARTAANPRPRPNLNVKRPAPRTAATLEGKRHKKPKPPVKKKPVAAAKKCAKPRCWMGTSNAGLPYRACACPKPKAKKGVKRPLIARSNQLVEGLSNPLYREGVRDGARAQLGLRAPGGGAQVPFSVTLPARQRKQTSRIVASRAQASKPRKKAAPLPRTRGGRKVVVPIRYAR